MYWRDPQILNFTQCMLLLTNKPTLQSLLLALGRCLLSVLLCVNYPSDVMRGTEECLASFPPEDTIHEDIKCMSSYFSIPSQIIVLHFHLET